MTQNGVVAVELECQLKLAILSDRINIAWERTDKSDFKGLSHQKDGVTSMMRKMDQKKKKKPNHKQANK